MNPTLIEEVIARAPSKPVPIDGWRWEGVLGFDAYKARVLELEAARAASRMS